MDDSFQLRGQWTQNCATHSPSAKCEFFEFFRRLSKLEILSVNTDCCASVLLIWNEIMALIIFQEIHPNHLMNFRDFRRVRNKNKLSMRKGKLVLRQTIIYWTHHKRRWFFKLLIFEEFGAAESFSLPKCGKKENDQPVINLSAAVTIILQLEIINLFTLAEILYARMIRN